jgi:membrane-bound serine protease (ClpP class)
LTQPGTAALGLSVRFARASLAAMIGLGVVPAGVGKATAATVAVLAIDGPIGPATADYVGRSFDKAVDEGAEVIVLRMNTPGGLADSMRVIIQEILAAPVPIVGYVAPSGAHAASAGTYILYACQVAAMAPGTNLGAATPVQIGGGGFPPGDSPAPAPEEEPDDAGDAGDEGSEPGADRPRRDAPTAGMQDKMVNDAVAYIRSLAQLRGRNADWAEKAVREAASLSASEALEAGVIDLIARNLDDLLAKIDGRTVGVAGGERTIDTADAVVVTIEPDWRAELLGLITNPNIAYILMLIGIYGIILEFYNPGMVFPGVTGAISLLLALYAFQVLPVNYAGLALIGLGLALMIAEMLVPSFGALGIGGVVAFVVGSIMLMDTDAPGFGISWQVVGGVSLTAASLLLLLMWMLTRSHGRPVVTGQEEMIGSRARVVDWHGQEGRVHVHGEVWRARGPAGLAPGQEVKVKAIEGLTVEVTPDREVTA